jgi:hypothetical protein
MKPLVLNVTLLRNRRILCPFTFECKNKESQTVGVEGEKGEKQQQSVLHHKTSYGEEQLEKVL